MKISLWWWRHSGVNDIKLLSVVTDALRKYVSELVAGTR